MLLALAGSAAVLVLVPVVVGLAILVGTTVPLEFGAAAGLTILASIKVAAMGSGLLAGIRAPLPAQRARDFD